MGTLARTTTRSLPRSTPQELLDQAELVTAYRGGDLAAGQRLVRDNQPFVRRIATPPTILRIHFLREYAQQRNRVKRFSRAQR